MNCFTGEDLKNKILAMGKLKSYRKRFCYTELEKYIFEGYDHRVMSIYGLKHTGKTTMMYQMIQQLDDYEHTCLIQCQSEDDSYDLTHTMDAHPDCKYFFIEEATCLENFVNHSAVLSDIYAFVGVKVVLSGTDSLGFYIAKGDQLFDRTYMLHTTYISYKEYNYLLGRDLEDYIMYGGTLTPENDFCSHECSREYSNVYITEHIQHILDSLGRNGEYGVLATFRSRDKLTACFNQIIELYNRQFMADIVNKNFKTHDIKKISLSFRQEIMDALQILENMSEKAYDRAIVEAKGYLKALDVIYTIPMSDEVIFIQPGLRYSQCTAQIESLSQNDNLNLTYEQRKNLSQTLDNDIKRRMLADIIYYQLINDTNITDLYDVDKYTSPHGEFDLTLIYKKTYEAYIITVKYSNKAVQNQTRNLNNQDVCEAFETKSGAKIIGKIVIYMGESLSDQIYGVNYISAEDFLMEPTKMLEMVHPLSKQLLAIPANYKEGTAKGIFASVYNKSYMKHKSHDIAAQEAASALYREGFDDVTVILTVLKLSPPAREDNDFTRWVISKVEQDPQIQEILKERQTCE